jgi:predicted nucleic acid-binding protein
MINSTIVVFDNNAVISAAILKNSPTARAFDLAVRDHRIIFSFYTLIELQEVLFRKKFDKYLSDSDRKLFSTIF